MQSRMVLPGELPGDNEKVTIQAPGLLCHLRGRCAHIQLEATLLLAVLYSLHKQPPPELKLH